MSRLTNDIDAINQAVSQNATSLVASVLSMAGILIAMFILDVWLAMAAVLVVPIMFWFTQFIAKYTRKGFRELQKHLGELNGVMEESISGEKVVKAFRRNETVIDAFRKYNEEVQRAGVYANTYALLLMPLTNVLGNFFVIVLAGLGGWLALQGLVTVGIIATFINYGQNFINPLRQLANIYNSIQSALAGAERVFEIIDSTFRGGRCAAGGRAAVGARRCVPGACPIRVQAGCSHHQGYDPGGQGRTDGGTCRSYGRGQDDHHQPADTFLRDRRRQHQNRRHGYP